jgi:hypothetical protein
MDTTAFPGLHPTPVTVHSSAAAIAQKLPASSSTPKLHVSMCRMHHHCCMLHVTCRSHAVQPAGIPWQHCATQHHSCGQCMLLALQQHTTSFCKCFQILCHPTNGMRRAYEDPVLTVCWRRQSFAGCHAAAAASVSKLVVFTSFVMSQSCSSIL